jgi:hypothetical protein
MTFQQIIFDRSPNTVTFDAIKDSSDGKFFCALTVWRGHKPLHTITCQKSSLFDACRIAESAAHLIEKALEQDQFVLPDMGDWKVEYGPD